MQLASLTSGPAPRTTMLTTVATACKTRGLAEASSSYLLTVKVPRTGFPFPPPGSSCRVETIYVLHFLDALPNGGPFGIERHYANLPQTQI